MNGPSQTLFKAKPFPTKTQHQALLKHCYASAQSLIKTEQFHSQVVTSGPHIPSPKTTAQLFSSLALSHARSGHDTHARKPFDKMPHRSVLSYNYKMKRYAERGLFLDVLKVFVKMLELGPCRADGYTYPFVLKACGELFLVELGRVVHGLTLVSSFGSNTFVQNSLLAMYMKCGEKEVAGRVFEAIKEKSVVSWNTMINGYFKNGCAKTALMVFDQMVDCGVEVDCASVVSVLPACGYLKELQVGRRVHKLVEERGLGKNVAVWNALMDMYARCGSMSEARLVFYRMVERDVVSWTSMINGYIMNGDVSSALMLCRLMNIHSIRPNSVTIASLLSACSSSFNYLKDGRCLHGWAIRQKLDSEVIIETSLIDMYAKCNCINLSLGVFARTSRKRTVPWNAVLSGCVHNGLVTDAIGNFKQMLVEGVVPNAATFGCLLPAYATLADMQPAKNIHCYLIKSGFFLILEVATCMIDIYSKCGSLDSAHEVFNFIPANDKDIFVWSVIIASYGMHGDGGTAVSLFRQMVQSGVKPNEVTFTSVLQACSHAGLVDEGLYLFNFMLKDHETRPSDDHYTCIVDLLGRAGRLDEAYNMIRTMPFAPSHAVWGALLGACVIHENVELGEVAAGWLFQVEPNNTGNYVLLAKLYAAMGRFKDAESVRLKMDDIGLRKAPAHSLINSRNT